MRSSAGPPPRGGGWAFEFLWDGLRCLVHVGEDRTRLVTDAGRDVTACFPEVAVPSTRTGPGAVLDGVVVAFDATGRPDAGSLGRRRRVEGPSAALQTRAPVALFVVDVLALGGRPTVRLPYRARRELLAELDLTGGRVVVPPSFAGADADAVLHTAHRYGLDGVVAKRLESTYQPGRRSRSWVQTPVTRAQDVVVGGWVPRPRRSGDAGSDEVGTLLVGVPTEAGLRYVGRVSTGVTVVARRELGEAVVGLDRSEHPFLGPGAPPPDDLLRRARWLAPRLVGTVAHRRWTATGLLDRPAWRGLRPGVGPGGVAAAAPPTPVLLAPVVDLDLALDDLEPADRPPPPSADSSPIPAPRTDVTMPRVAALATAPISPGDAVRGDAGEAALRSRFSQHFVHNTLTAIAAYVRTDPGRARDLLTEFADFTRYSFRPAGELTTVAEEMGNAERYLTLEVARFGSRLRAHVSVAPEVADVALPPFVVAPLVENAVRHGIEPVPGGGRVEVTATRAGADCVITVSDDGAGGADAHGAGGLGEVSRRLDAAFAGAAVLHVDSRPGLGTTVRVRVPAGARDLPER